MIGPEVILPLLISGVEQFGHAIPLNASAWGSHNRKRYSGHLAVDPEAVSAKKAGLQGIQNVLSILYIALLVALACSEPRSDLKASSTLCPACAIGLGAARAARRVDRNAFELVRANSAQSSPSGAAKDGSRGNMGGGGGMPGGGSGAYPNAMGG